MRTRDQRFAVIVHAQMAKITAPAAQQKYGGMTHQLPVLVRTAGLAQSLAYAEAVGRDPNSPIGQLLNDVANTVGLASRATLLETSRNATLAEYTRLTDDVLAALVWYKRFAQALWGVTGPEDTTHEERPAQSSAVGEGVE